MESMARNDEQKNCIIHARVSSPKQAQDGDSLDDQIRIGENLAERKAWNVLARFKEPFSARKTNRPVFLEIIDYIKKSKVPVHYYIFKSIDRFTRLGVPEYLYLKEEIEKLGVEVVDSYGVIQPKVNSLSHLGVRYSWSEYSPSEAGQLLEATRAQQEVRDILTRMVGAEIRLVRLGYLVRNAPDGYLAEKIIDNDGRKKIIAIPDPKRAQFYVEMFKLRASGIMSDEEIVDRINAMGFQTRTFMMRSKDKTRIIGKAGSNKLTVKQLQRIIARPIYAGFICEKWTDHKPIKAQFKGLVSVELFNKANRGKNLLKEVGANQFEFFVNQREPKRLKNNPLYPFKFIPCSKCGKPLLGSAPRSRSGKRHPLYHCGRGHKQYSIKKEILDQAVEKLLEGLQFDPGYLNAMEATFLYTYHEREKEILDNSASIHRSIADLKEEQSAKIETLVHTKSEVVRREMEKGIDDLEVQIKQARKERQRIEINEHDIKWFIKEAKNLMEHPVELLLNPEFISTKEALFGLVFEKTPNYEEIVYGTAKLAFPFSLSSSFKAPENQLVTLPGVEPGFQA